MPNFKSSEAILEVKANIRVIEASIYSPYELKRWMEIRLIANRMIKHLKEKSNANH